LSYAEACMPRAAGSGACSFQRQEDSMAPGTGARPRANPRFGARPAQRRDRHAPPRWISTARIAQPFLPHVTAVAGLRSALHYPPDHVGMQPESRHSSGMLPAPPAIRRHGNMLPQTTRKHGTQFDGRVQRRRFYRIEHRIETRHIFCAYSRVFLDRGRDGYALRGGRGQPGAGQAAVRMGNG
jgi:hypothetical protein